MLAREFARLRKTNMTEAIAQALKAEIRRERDKRPLKERLGELAGQLPAEAGPNGHVLTKEEIDELWGQWSSSTRRDRVHSA
jgi:antitoxin VapB